ncbi:MAG TPA: tetratricopeptide repeat protein [Gemmatimonadaceae bacterium]
MRRYVAAVIVAALVVSGWLAARTVIAGEPDTSPAIGGSSTMAEASRRDDQIRVWKIALSQDSTSSIALGQLAALYSQRARETGVDADYGVAEQYARRSIAFRANRNGKTFVTLASVLLAEHRFVDAEKIARELVELDPETPQYRALLAEIELELGNYGVAKREFDSLYPFRSNLSIAPRLARWYELTGNGAAARKLLRNAVAASLTRREMPREQVAWFHLRAGDIEARQGRLRTARSLFEQGLKIEPNDYRLLSAMASLEAVEARPRKAIELGERAIAIKLDPATLGTIGDAYAAIGDAATAADYVRTMEVAVAGQPGPYHRAWSLFLLDHGKRYEEVLSNARAELETRRDIYGYDLLAWALHRNGHDLEARFAMDSALRMGTRDASLDFHAGMIERSLGDAPRARFYLERALRTNPRFHPTHAREARSVLDSMTREQKQ